MVRGGRGVSGRRWLSRRDIPAGDGGGGYLTRWHLTPAWLPWGVYLHRFTGGDLRTWHDHPWRSWSLVLRGGYVEHRPAWLPAGPKTPDRTVRYEAGAFIRRAAEHAHWLELEPGRSCWTLFATGRKVRSWGFWAGGAWVPHRDYLGRRS